MADQDEPVTVRLRVPAQPHLVRMARLASSALATVGGADIETIDDIKIAVDEVCASLIEAGDGSDVDVEFVLDGDQLSIIGQTPGATTIEIDAERFALSRQILRAVAERHDLTTEGGMVRFAVTCALQGPPDGA